MSPNPVELLRATKGAPLSILVAFIISTGPLGHDFLVRATGWSKDKVTEGLQVLRELELIEPIPGKRYCGWVLSNKVHQLGLFDGNPKIQDSLYTSTKYLEEQTLNNSSSSRAIECDNLGLDQREVLGVLHSAGIFGKTAIDLCKMTHVTLEYAQSHIAKAKRERKPVNLLIYRMKQADPMPEDDDAEYKPQAEGIYAEWINT